MTAPVAWVTGASGFIGTHVGRRFRELGWTAVGIDRRPPDASAHRVIVGDVGPDTLDAALAVAGTPQAVFHGAGNGSVGRSIEDPAMCRRDTLESTNVLLDTLRRSAPNCRVVLPSSAAVYGAAPDVALAEDREPAPVSPYGRHKLAAETTCLAAAAAGQPVAILRMFSVYGSGLRKQLPWDLGQKLKGGGDVTLFGTGKETRDFFDVRDAARLIVDLATRALPSPLVVNGGTGVATTVAAFAGQFAEAMQVAAVLHFNGIARPGDPQFYRADVQRLGSLGFTPEVTLERGIRDYAAWFLADTEKH